MGDIGQYKVAIISSMLYITDTSQKERPAWPPRATTAFVDAMILLC